MPDFNVVMDNEGIYPAGCTKKLDCKKVEVIRSGRIALTEIFDANGCQVSEIGQEVMDPTKGTAVTFINYNHHSYAVTQTSDQIITACIPPCCGS